MHALVPLIILSALAAPPQFDVQLVDGSKVSGTLTRWDEAQLVVETSSGARELNVAKVASVAAHLPPAKPAAKPAVLVELLDGSSVVAENYTTETNGGKLFIQGKVQLSGPVTTGPPLAKISLVGGGSLESSVALVASVRLQPESESTAIEWSRLRGKKLPGDLLVTGNQSGIDYHQGTIEDVAADKVHFTIDGKTLSVKRSKVYGLIYYHAIEPSGAKYVFNTIDADGMRHEHISQGYLLANEAPYTVVDSDGSRWMANGLKLNGETIEFNSAFDSTIRRSVAQIAQVDLSCGKIVYLSDLKADSEKVSSSPFTLTSKALASRAQFSRVRRDENMESKSLRLFGQVFRKGMAMQSRSELAWTLPSQFARLQAIAGIDDDIIRPLGNVRLRILGDGKTLFDEPISGADKAAKPISVDMTGVRRLVVVVESQGNFGAGDHLVLGNLRLIK